MLVAHHLVTPIDLFWPIASRQAIVISFPFTAIAGVHVILHSRTGWSVFILITSGCKYVACRIEIL